MSDSFSPRRPIVELLALALPTVAQMASYTVMQFIDTWMLSRIGDVAATAASNSGILAFAIVAFAMGTVVLVNTLVSQSFGAGRFEQCGQFLWQGIWLGLFYGVAVLPLIALGGPIFSLFHHPPVQTALETQYYQIVLVTAALKLIATSIGQFFLGINRANAVLVSAVMGVSVNALAAWCIVLGHLGFASHGVAGAAWAQNIGVTSELLTLILLVLRPAIRREYNVLDYRFRPDQFTTLIRIGLPSGCQWLSDVTCWSLFANGVLGVLGPAAMAANTFTFRYMVVSFLPVYGLSTAVTALVGRYIGRGTPQVGKRRAHLGLFVSLVYVACCGAIFITCGKPLIHVFSDNPEVIRIGAIYLTLISFYEISDALYITYMGALRGAGDTLYPTMVSAVLCWSIVVVGAYAMARSHQQFVSGPWIVACGYGWTAGSWMLIRFVRGKWKKIEI
jgi:multidrug resistance protein, MATE family